MRGFLSPWLLVLGTLDVSPATEVPLELVDQRPETLRRLDDGTLLVDFGRVAFGNLRFDVPAGAEGTITVRFGEAEKDGRVDRQPPGTVRYAEVTADLAEGGFVVAPPPDERNTKQPAAILTPAEWGVVLPFRWVEVEGWPGELTAEQVTRQAGFLATWNDAAADFSSSSELLDDIWELCRYSIKATTFAGLYVDGDRERIPYEADAYLNQLSHYATDDDVLTARATFDRLIEHPTWPSEWAPHMVFMAHADWMHTGDTTWLAPRYESLMSKLLIERARPSDGLVVSNDKQQSWNDIVDWPQGERDGYVFREVNTVVNAFHLAALGQISELAAALGKQAEAERFASLAEQKRAVFNEQLFMEAKGCYRDGIGTDHASQHASLFPLAFGLVPEGHEEEVAEFLADKGMRCSVYAAQYLLEGLFRHGRAEEALGLITAEGDRSWKHMLESGTTITWEAWDQKYKPNQDWNHAWGAAPANLLPRFVLGVEPDAPGWTAARIQPHPCGLKEARGRVPTPKGTIEVHWSERGAAFGLRLSLPEGVEARVALPSKVRGRRVFAGDEELAANWDGSWLRLKEPVTGSVELVVR